VQLNLFVEQLYLSSFMECVEVCTFLGLAWEKAEEGCVDDGFIMRDGSDCERPGLGSVTILPNP